MGLFDTPSIVAPKAKTKAKAKAEVAIEGLQELAMIDALQKALEGVRASIEGAVKGAALARFVEYIRENGVRPESFKGIEKGASASLELRRKGSNIPLSEGAVAMLNEYGIEPAKEVTTPRLFALNPQYAENAELLAKVDAALSGIVPADFIMLQEERSKRTVSEETLAQALKVMQKNHDAPAELLSTMTTLACKPKLVSTNLAAIFDYVQGLLVGDSFGAAAAEAKVTKLRLVA